jgi:Cu+-exporting ATPase
MAMDPVCGMQVDEKSAAGSVEHEGQTYYFCSVSCQRAFEADPDAYAGSA